MSKNNLYLSRSIGKDPINFELALLQSQDKTIYYISRIHGDRYIVPKEMYEKQTKELGDYKAILDILENKSVNINIIKIFIHPSFSKWTDEENLDYYNNHLYHGMEKLTMKEYILLKNWLKNWNKGEQK